MKTKTPFLLSLLSICFLKLNAQDQKQWTILFPFDEYVLNEAAKAELDELVIFLETVVLGEVHLQGHTDGKGNNAYNQTLSTNRAIAVRDYLVSKGLDSEKIKTDWFGEEQPQADNESAVGRQRNRRVVVQLTYERLIVVIPIVTEAPIAPEIETPVPTTIAIPEDIKLKLDKSNTATFAYNCKGDIQITGQRGAILRIPEGVLVDCDELGKLEVKMHELTSKNDIVNSKASTYSGNQMLQSGGMVFFDITKDGRRVNMNGCLEVVVPGPKVEGMQPYYTSNTTNKAQIDWKKRQGEIRYDDLLQAYVMEICGEISGSFGVNADKPIDDGYKGKVLVKVKQLNGQFPGIAVENSEGAITNLRRVTRKAWTSRKWAYYTFPVIENEPLTVIGTYSKHAYGSKSDKRYHLGQPVIYDAETGPLRLKRVGSLKHKGAYYVIKDFPTLKFEKGS